MALQADAGLESSALFVGGVVALVVCVRLLLQCLQAPSSELPADDFAKKPSRKAAAQTRTRSAFKGCVVDASPAECWQGHFGRFKHRGLRPDPLDPDEGPPEYSFRPLDLPLPSLSSQQADALEALRARVSDLTPRHRTDSSTLLRYLKARKFDVGRTEPYFREAARWREEHGVNEALTHWNLKAYEECLAPWWLSGGFLGHGLRGEMIAYERISRCNWAGLVRRMPWKELEKLDVVHVMRSLAACEEDSKRHGVPLGNGILIQDCQGFGFDQASLSAVRALNRLVENRNLLMPECLTKILVIHAPAAWIYAWKMFSYVLDPGIREKVKVAGNREGESLALLRQYIADDDIPAYLGGNKYIDGDPECRKVLAPGGEMPEEALQRFLQLVAQSPTAASETPGGRAKEKQEDTQTDGGWASCLRWPAAEREREDGGEEEKSGRSCCG